MASQTQFGHTLFLSGFEADSKVEKLNKLHLSKNAAAPAPYNEAWLQRLIMRHPSLLPVDQIEKAFSPLVPICVELPMKSGFMDNLFVTPNGNLALVECKLWRNPEARREVIAQIIDYATEISSWTYEALQDAIRRTKLFDRPDEKQTQSLYERVSAEHEIDEAVFHDNVMRNLKLGRFLLLIVGDGIREGMEGMAQFLQQHAGFHFTLAFVEIALFKTREGYIAQPRVLAKTTNIERGIVKLEEGRIVIGPPSAGQRPDGNGGRTTTITQELYFEELEKKFPGIQQSWNAFLDALAPYNVQAEFGTETMILRWRQESGKAWNLGTITKQGLVWLDYLGQQANNAGLLEFHKGYLKTLAKLAPGATVRETPKETAWFITLDGKHVITVDALVANEERRNGWVQAIAEFQAAVVMKASPDE